MSNTKTIENLNKALRMEISATHQYQLHAHVLEDWGLVGLAAQSSSISGRVVRAMQDDGAPIRGGGAVARAKFPPW